LIMMQNNEGWKKKKTTMLVTFEIKEEHGM
jgi:hypothetical protein